jgi:hypothetical protein
MAAKFLNLVLVMALVTFAGCAGDNYGSSPVNGTVLVDGEPAANVVVTFTPLATAETSIVGPFSTGITDDSGKFTLKTKQGDPGAVPGDHIVALQYRGVDPESAGSIQEAIEDARAENEDVSELAAKLKAANAQKVIPQKYSENSKLKVTVPPGGLKDHKIEISTKD